MINSPELHLLFLNFAVLILVYWLVYPKFCGTDIKKLLTNDVIASVIILLISGSLFWDTGEQFSLLVTSVNWFWFSLITYLVMEVPFMLYYMKKHNMDWPD